MGILTILLLIGGALSGLTGLAGGEAEDQPQAAPPPDNGQEPGDLVVGTDDADLLAGGDGADWLLGLNGADILTSGSGDDVVIGGTGPDEILAGAGNDFVESANIIAETALRNSAETGDIDDVVFEYDLPRASDEGDLVELGDGDDTVVAGSDDVVTGGAGADEFSLGDWITGGRPVEITDFDEAEDVVSFVYDRDGDVPELDILRDSQTGVTTIRADGQSIAVLRGASPDFSLLNVVVGRYAA